MKLNRTFRNAGVAITLALGLGCALAPAADAAAGNYYLNVGEKLKVGQCLVSHKGYANAVTKLCLNSYGQGVVYYKGKVVSEFGPSVVRSPITGAYLTKASNGNVLIYQYAGGPQIYSSHTTNYAGSRLDVSSCVITDKWNLAFDKPGSYYATWYGNDCIG